MVDGFRRWLALISTCLVMGCVGSKADDEEAVREKLQKYILDAPPKDVKLDLNLNYDNKATLLGYTVSPNSGYRPGKDVKLTLYWKLTQDLPPGWNLFTHVLDASGARLLNIDNVGPLRRWRGGGQTLPPSEWTVGKIYVDEQTFTIPRQLNSDSIQIVAGVFKGETRLKVVKGAHDDENRGLVAQLSLRKRTPKKRSKKTRKSKSSRLAVLPKLAVYKLRAGDKLTIDGVLNEPGWRMAISTRQFVDVKTGERNKDFPVNARCKLLWDDAFMYLGFDVKDQDVVGDFDKKAKDPHLWTEDAIEIMIDPDGDGDNKDYYEIQIGPQNLVFDSFFDSYNEPKPSKDGPFGHEDWSARATSAVTIRGTLGKKDRDDGYTVEAKIPWKSFHKAKRVPPKTGDTWRMNFYALQENSGVAWSPILGKGNFHKASRFGHVTWRERDDNRDPLRARLGRDAGPRTQGIPHLQGRGFERRPPVPRPSAPSGPALAPSR